MMPVDSKISDVFVVNVVTLTVGVVVTLVLVPLVVLVVEFDVELF